MTDRVKTYEKDNFAVVWNPDLCAHSGNCVDGLPEVFEPSARPWIKTGGASSEEIIRQVRKCPSGALSIEYRGKAGPEQRQITQVEIQPSGPLRIRGPFTLILPNGQEEDKRIASFCRCGHSSNKPFCDGTHKAVRFDQ